MPPVAPAAPAMPAAPGGPEAGPSVVVPNPQPEAVVSMSPADVAERQALVSQVTRSIPPDEALRSIVSGGEPSQQAQAPETSQAADASVSEAQQAPGQEAFAEIKNLEIEIGPDTNFDELYAKLQQEHQWQENPATKQWIQDALTYAQSNQATETASLPETSSTEQTVTQNQQTAEATVANQPSEETIQQALTALSLEDTPVNRETAKQLIAAKEQQEQAKAEAAAQKTVDVVKGEEKKEQTLSPDEQAVMKTLTEMAMKETENFKKFFAALAKDDPEYAKELADNLKLYREMVRKEKDARNRKLLIGLGVIAFIIFVAYTTLGPGAGEGR